MAKEDAMMLESKRSSGLRRRIVRLTVKSRWREQCLLIRSKKKVRMTKARICGPRIRRSEPLLPASETPLEHFELRLLR
jgi:hypothetical protein